MLTTALWGGGCGSGVIDRGSTVIYASGADLQSINPLVTVHPLAKAVQKHVLFMTLATYDASLRPIPRLAEAWEWGADRTRLTFTLRQDVRWHDGRPTTADDVLHTLRLARDPATGYPRRRELSSITSIANPDSFTVVVEFGRAQVLFPDVLTDLAMLPAHLLADVAPRDMRRARFNNAPVGNGPFRFVEHRPNQRWVFERNADFPRDLPIPVVERFVIVVVDEATTKLAALTSGELDFAGVSPAHAAFVASNPRLRLVDFPMLFSYGVFWNHRRPPFDDLRVRRALTMAIDRQGIIDGYLYGFGTPATGPVSPAHPWYGKTEGIPFDPAGARALLDSLAWRGEADGVRVKAGKRFAFELMTVTGDLGLEQMIQAQLRDVGVEVTLRPLELTTFLAVARGPDRDFDVIVTGIPGDLALGYVEALFSGDGPLAYTGYASEVFDAAVWRARNATNAAEIAGAWREAQTILDIDVPATWVYHARGVQGVTERIINTRPDLRGELGNLHEWRFANGGAR